MTVRTVISKLTHNEANVKVTSSAASDNDTIGLTDDLKLASDTLAGPIVDIAKIMWSQAAGSTNYITITRNSVVICLLYNSGEMDFNAKGMSEDEGHGSDIVVTFVGAPGTIYMKLKKTTGYGD